MAKVILTYEVGGLGAPGDVVEVKNGYARNYLLPRGLAMLWSIGAQKQIATLRAAIASRAVASVESANALKQSLESKAIRLEFRARPGGKLFGSVRAQDVCDAIKRNGMGDIERRNVVFSTPIKQTGSHTVAVKIYEDIVANIRLHIAPLR